MVYRIDRGSLKKPTKTSNGWLRVDGLLTRTGVFTYVLPDGSKHRELRLPEEVFKADALESFASVPVTDEHPKEFLTAKNTREHMRGHVDSKLERDGDYVVGSLFVTDAELIAKMEKGDARELSCGYVCELEDKPGVTADGEKYDSIQRNIRGNHVAVVPRGRAGPEARVRMDAGEAEEPTSNKTPTEKKTMNKIRIDGVDYEAGSEAAAQAFAKLVKKHDDDISAQAKLVAAANEKAEKLQAKVDSQAEELKKKDAELAELPAKIMTKAKARADLEQSARKVLGSKAVFAEKSDDAVRKAVIKAVSPELKLDGKSEAYVEARFDMAVESFEAEADEAEETRSKVDPVEQQDEDDVDGSEVEVDAEAARKRMRKDSLNAHKETLKRHGMQS